MKMMEFGFIIKAIDAFSSVFAKIEHQIKGVEAAYKQGEGVRKIAGHMAEMGAASMAAGAAIALPLVEAVKGYEDLQEHINNVAASTGGLTAMQREGLETFAKTQDVINGFSAQQMVDAVYQGTSAFLSLQQAEAVAAVAGKVARSTKGDPMETAKALTTLMLNFSDKSKSAIQNATMLGDKFTAIQTTGKWSNLTELTTALGHGAPVAMAYKISLDQTLGAMSALSASGYGGGRAGTAFLEIVSQLQKKHAELGVSIAYNATGQMDLFKTFQNLQARAADMSTAQRAELFGILGTRAGPATADLLEHLQQFQDSMGKAAHSAGATDTALSQFQQHGLLAFQNLHNAVSNVADSIGGALAPSIEGLTKYIAAFAAGVQKFADAHPQLLRIGTEIAAIAAGVFTLGGAIALGAAALAGFASLSPVVMALAGAFGLVTASEAGATIGAAAFWSVALLGIPLLVAGIAAASYAIYEYWGPIAAWFQGQWTQITTAASAAWNFIATLPANIFSKWIPEFFDWGAKLLKEFALGIMSVIDYPAHAVEAMVTKLAKYLPHLSPAEIGPLSTLDRLPFSETFAESMKPGPVIEAMTNLVRAATPRIPFTISEAVHVVHSVPALRLPVKTISTSLGGASSAAPISDLLPSSETLRAINMKLGPLPAIPAFLATAPTPLSPVRQEMVGAPRASSARRSGDFVIHYSPNITVNGASGSPQDWVKAMHQHRDELMRVIKDQLNREARLRFEDE